MVQKCDLCSLLLHFFAYMYCIFISDMCWLVLHLLYFCNYILSVVVASQKHPTIATAGPNMPTQFPVITADSSSSLLTSVQHEMAAVRRQHKAGISRQDSRLSVKSLIESIENATKQAKAGEYLKHIVVFMWRMSELFGLLQVRPLFPELFCLQTPLPLKNNCRPSHASPPASHKHGMSGW